VHDLFPVAEQRLLRAMANVTSNGGVVHPLVHTHPISGRLRHRLRATQVE
jgi:hypothetical protein